MLALASRLGITRLANVTGLDHVGIPVAQSCRPRSRSVAVSQGKGATLAAAKASALMESVECWHAERIISPLRLASHEELLDDHRATAAIERLARVRASRYHEGLRLPWIEGRDLFSDRALWLPYELVHTDYRVPLPPGGGCFPASSNGLASGNDMAEAIVHALCEVIERDASTLWWEGGAVHRAARRLDLSTVDDPVCTWLLERFDDAGVTVAVWDTTSDIGVAAFEAYAIDATDDPLRVLCDASGMGCHPAREVALARALTEAAQSRLAMISGARDDLRRSLYGLKRDRDRLAGARGALVAEGSPRSFRDVPTACNETIDGDVGWLLQQLASIELGEVVVVDLSREWTGVAVVRVVVPGLESASTMPDYEPGPRALAASRSAARAGDHAVVESQT